MSEVRNKKTATVKRSYSFVRGAQCISDLTADSMSIQDGVRIIDPNALARYGTADADDRAGGYEISSVPYGSVERPDPALLYRRHTEHPSFWTSVFSAYVVFFSPSFPLRSRWRNIRERFESDYKQVDTLSHSVIDDYQPVLSQAGASVAQEPFVVRVRLLR